MEIQTYVLAAPVESQSCLVTYAAVQARQNNEYETEAVPRTTTTACCAFPAAHFPTFTEECADVTIILPCDAVIGWCARRTKKIQWLPSKRFQGCNVLCLDFQGKTVHMSRGCLRLERCTVLP